jgi:predicted nucleic acid-binding protein
MIAPDTSVVVAALASWHDAHAQARAVLRDQPVRLIGHVAFETTSTLSRMPHGSRLSAAVVMEALERRFPEPWLALNGADLKQALRRVVDAGIRGGALYDALIGATAAHAGARIVTTDRRAAAAYEAVEADALLLA